MTPEEARGRMLARRALIGAIWFLGEAVVLGLVVKLAADGKILEAWALGIFLILLSYFEGRFRK